MMNPEIKQKWVQALRSGQYQQGKHHLKNDKNQFCCLGVLCDILKSDINGYWDENNYFVTPLDNCKTLDLLPMSVVNLTGLNSCNPYYTTVDGSNLTLSYKNDYFDYDFNQIADIIDTHF